MVKLSAMWNKIYLVLLLVAILAMCAITFICNNQFSSYDNPISVLQRIETYISLYWNFLWISSAILLILANVLMWINKKAWAIWSTFIFFAVFVLLQTFWLENSYLAFQQKNGLTDKTFSAFGIVGALLCLGVGVGLFFNQFIVFRLRDKMFGEKKETIENVQEVSEEVQ
jgi:hypothetical protein